MTLGMLQLPGHDRELSVYGTEAYYAGPGSRIRRFSYRVDGFVSATAAEKGELITKPLVFKGAKLSLNIVSKGATGVELQDADGKALTGFSLEDCTPISGDHIDHTVSWKGGSLTALAGKPVRLRFMHAAGRPVRASVRSVMSAPSSSPAKSAPLRAAALDICITPAAGALTASKTGASAQVVAGPLRTTVTLLEHGDLRVCLITPHMNSPKGANISPLIRRSVAEALGLPVSQVLLMVSHNHTDLNLVSNHIEAYSALR